MGISSGQESMLCGASLQKSYHSEELAKLLRERGVQEKTILRLLPDCRSWGYLDDERWLESLIGQQRQRYSLRLILSKLRAKGISPETLQCLASEWKDPEEEVKAIVHLLQTRYHRQDLTQYKVKQKVVAALARKGYDFHQIDQAFREMKD